MKMIILDRDGVINQEHQDSHVRITSPEEWIAIPGSLEAIQKFSEKDYTIVVVTNQSGIGRGVFSLKTLEDIHKKMLDQVNACGGIIHRIYFCPHRPEDHCECRKPKPGLFRQIEKDYLIDLSEVYFIGDSLVDYQASLAAGCKFGLVLTGKGEKTFSYLPQSAEVPVFKNLWEVSKNF